MDRIEMSNLFDVLFNNITSNQAPGINEFEKSVFLTKAQNQLVMEYFNQRVDQVGGGFDGSQKRQYDFSSLIKTAKLLPHGISDDEKLDRRSKGYLFPSDYFLSVNEIIEDSQYQYAVMPIDYNEYYRLMQKPFAFPPKKTVWRLLTGKNSQHHLNITYIISNAEDEPLEDPWFSEDNYSGQYRVNGPGGAYELHDFKELAEEYNPSIYYGLPYDQHHLAFIDGASIFELGYYEVDGDIYYYLYGLNGTSITDSKVANILKRALNLDIELSSEVSSDFTVSRSEYDSKPNGTSDVAGKAFPIGDLLPVAELIGSIITKKNTSDITYKMRYVHQLNPIILTDLSAEYGTDVKIDGKQEPMDCELPEETHQEIVERAVTLAKIAWAGGTATQAAAQRSKD